MTDPEFVRWVKSPEKELNAYWQKWMQANPENLTTLKEAKEILLRVEFDAIHTPKGLKEETLQQILKQKPAVESPGKLEVIKRKSLWMFFWDGWGQMTRVAAILLVGFGFVWMLVPIQEEKPMEETYMPEMVKRATAAGEKKQLTLADGTRVWLNASSSLEFPRRFDAKTRQVKLTGEAYFEVEKDSLRSFEVDANGLTTVVLGTSFNINTKKKERISVSLVSGKIAVDKGEGFSRVTLEPGEALDFIPDTREHRINRFDARKVLAWKQGYLIFERASLGEVVERLEDWYGVNIQIVGAKDTKWEFSGEYKNQMLEEILESMAFIQGLDYRIRDKEVTITVRNDDKEKE